MAERESVELELEEAEEILEDAQAPLGRRLAAEFVGTLLFVALGAGAATVAAMGPLQRLGGLLDEFGQAPPGQDVLFGALIGTGPPTITEILPVAFAFATGLAVLVYAFGGVSGAHFNPAVTFALAVSRRFKWSEVPLYWIVQCIGAIAGAAIIVGIFGDLGGSINGTEIYYGATTVSENIDFIPAVLAEAFIAFLLMTAVMGVAVDPRAPKGWSGLVIGFALGAGILFTATATGGSANFARSLGPLVVSALKGVEDVPWGDLAVYALGPMIGAAAAALIYESVSGLELVSPAPGPGAATGSPDLAEDVVDELELREDDEPGGDDLRL